MKRKLIYGLFVAFATTCGILGYLYQSHSVDMGNQEEENVKANVEALSESETSYTMACATDIEYNGSWSCMVLYCTTCSYRLGWTGLVDSRCP